jgi:hypothetical protein
LGSAFNADIHEQVEVKAGEFGVNQILVEEGAVKE